MSAEDPVALVPISLCVDCGRRFSPRGETCVGCFGRHLVDAETAAHATITALCVVRQAPAGYDGAVPYVVAGLRLADGVTLVSHLSGEKPEVWKIGMAVVAPKQDGEPSGTRADDSPYLRFVRAVE